MNECIFQKCLYFLAFIFIYLLIILCWIVHWILKNICCDWCETMSCQYFPQECHCIVLLLRYLYLPECVCVWYLEPSNFTLVYSWRNPHSVLQSSCSRFTFPANQEVGSFSPHFLWLVMFSECLSVAIQTGVSWYLIGGLICFSLLFNDVDIFHVIFFFFFIMWNDLSMHGHQHSF